MAWEGEDGLVAFLRLRLRRAWGSIDEPRAVELVRALQEHCADGHADVSVPAPPQKRSKSENVAASHQSDFGEDGTEEKVEQTDENTAREQAADPSAHAIDRRCTAAAQARMRLRRLGEAVANEVQRHKPDWALHGSRPKVVEAVAALESRRSASIRAFETLRGIHDALRERGDAVPTVVELDAYAKAARVVGGKSWSRDVTSWVLAELGLPAAAGSLPQVPLRLLDIGSSFGAFCDVPGLCCTAVDLAPAHPEVLRGDFLQVPIMENLEQERQVDAATGSLEALGAGAFDVAVLSLVLSFLPTPALRRQMLERARRCLRRPCGTLFVVEKTSLAPRGSLEDKARLVAFREALEAAGFRVRSYAAVGRLEGGTRPHAHAWRLVAETEPRTHPGPTFREDTPDPTQAEVEPKRQPSEAPMADDDVNPDSLSLQSIQAV